MQRRSFLKTAGIIAFLANIPFVLLNAQKPMKKVNFRHVVYFWLNNPEDAAQRKQFLTNLKEFIESMEIIPDAFIGAPAQTSREVVDSSYQYSLNLGFEDKVQHDKYQDHELHKRFIDKSAHLWKRVVVYDSVPV
jgi:hypothetical protein